MLAMLSMVEHYTMKELASIKILAGYLNDVQEELMDAILYIQAAKEELNDKLVSDAIKAADHAAFKSSSAQLDWDDAIAPV